MAGTPFDPFAPITVQVMQTQLLSSPFTQPVGCGPGRTESTVRMQSAGKMYNFVFRDKVGPEDWFVTDLKAPVFSISRTEQYRGVPPARVVRDFLIKTNLVT